MISFAEFEIAVLGLLRLARFDAGFAGFFDLSPEGARRSFRLALPLLPIYLLLMHLNADWPDGTDMVRVVLAEVIGYSLMWVAFPLLLISGARLIERESRIYGTIAVYNWLSVLFVGLQLPIEIAYYFGLDQTWVSVLSIAVLLFNIACEFFAFKRLLAISLGVTAALVAVEFILTRIIVEILVGMAHGPLFGGL